MKQRSSDVSCAAEYRRSPFEAAPHFHPGYLHLVSAQEIHELRQALEHGEPPADFEAKLARLQQGDLLHRSVARSCRLFMALLQAAHHESFKAASLFQRERLLRVLAYVRKDEDAIADYKPLGFVDDQQAVRAIEAELDQPLKVFKAWRLQHQVPQMWRNLRETAPARQG